MSITKAITAYKQLADALRNDILEHVLQPGEKLPSERRLCEQFSASRITVRQALQLLSDERLISRRQGSGTYVSATPTRRIPLLSTDFSGSVAVHAPDLVRRVEDWKWTKASAAVACRLQLRSNARVLFAKRVDSLGNDPVAFDEVYLPEFAADNLDRSNLSELRFLDTWQVVQGIRIDYVTQEIEAIAAQGSQCRTLQLRKLSPILTETNVCYLESALPCGLFHSYYRSEIFRVVSTVKLSNLGTREIR